MIWGIAIPAYPLVIIIAIQVNSMLLEDVVVVVVVVVVIVVVLVAQFLCR